MSAAAKRRVAEILSAREMDSSAIDLLSEFIVAMRESVTSLDDFVEKIGGATGEETLPPAVLRDLFAAADAAAPAPTTSWGESFERSSKESVSDDVERVKRMFPGLAAPNRTEGPIPLPEDAFVFRPRTKEEPNEGDERESRSAEERIPAHVVRLPANARDPLSPDTDADTVYCATVSRIESYGCFVELAPSRVRGLVHVSRMAPRRVERVEDEVSLGQRVYVQIVQRGADGKLGMAMKTVDQVTGALLGEPSGKRPTAPSSFSATGANAISVSGSLPLTSDHMLPQDSKKSTAAAPAGTHKVYQEFTPSDLWEERLLRASGMLPSGGGSVLTRSAVEEANAEEDSSNEEDEPSRSSVSAHRKRPAGVDLERLTERDTEVEMVTEPPRFLRGDESAPRDDSVPYSLALAPIKIVANPDGSLQRAAMTQTALQKERRELRQIQAQQLLDATTATETSELQLKWIDPMAAASERKLVAEVRGGSGSTAPGQSNEPEWRAKAFGGNIAFGNTTKTKSSTGEALTLAQQRESLPVFQLKNQLMRAMAENQVLIVIGETGSGKTTQMTQYVLEWGFAHAARGPRDPKRIVGCTQPRRVAAISVAKRVAEEYGCLIGEEVGYTIRFEDCTSDKTVIKYMTDGMLMREYLVDGDLSRYSVIILDEAHERTLHTDVLFALLKALVKRRDLKLVVTSATLDAEKFSKYFFNCPIFSIPGRPYPVEILYAKEPEEDYLEASLVTVMQIHLSEPAGDILLFLTGQEEIDQACETLYNRLKALGSSVPELFVLPVYGALPSEMQSRIFEPSPPGTRKCVVATNIAEASLTIDGIYYVVDPGFAKQNVFNPKTGMDSLVVTPISQASARQRAGRAGRTGPGKCYRLYTEAAFKTEMLPTSVPELQRTNLGNVVLQLKAMGINDLLGFDFMDPPPQATLVAAMESLYALEALDEDGLLTRLGRKMAEFPLEPNLCKTLITAVDMRCADEVLSVVAMLSVEGIFYRPRDKQNEADQRKARFSRPEGDHMTLLAVYEGWRDNKFSTSWCKDNYIQSRSIMRAEEIRKQLMGILERYKMPVESCRKVRGGRGIDDVRRAFTAGFFTHAAKRDPQEGFRTMVEGQVVYIHPGSALFQKNPETVLYHELILTTKEWMRNVMSIDAKWLVELAPKFYRESDPEHLSTRKKRERVEPMMELKRGVDKDAWRLTRRKVAQR